MFTLSRREFLKGSALLAAAAAGVDLSTSVSDAAQTQPTPAGNGDRLNVAVIGIRGRGRDHIRGFAGRHGCVVTHLCDCDTASVPQATITQTASAQGGQRPTFVRDLRRIMDDRNIQIVSIATPNHWHSLAAIWAIQAGKDVYVEKPVSHNVSEGRRVVQFARHHNKICQAGTQIRSSTGVRQAIEWLRAGNLGQVNVARGLCYKPRNSIGTTQGAQAIPSTIDYNLWCGPASNALPRRRNLHYDWHWTWEYGNGDLGNQGIHQVDVARWGLGKNELCRSILSVGGRFGYTDDGETANTQIALYDFGDAKMIFEVRGLPTPAQRGASVGNIFHCANGYMVLPNYNRAVAHDNDGREIRSWQGADDHYGNFVRAVRSRRRQDLHGDIEEGHLSSALCHLANISYRLGEMRPFGQRAEAFGDDRVANETLAAMTDHLRTNSVDVANTMLRVGRRLTIDPRTEQFLDNAEANRHLTREYRQNFVVPARV